MAEPDATRRSPRAWAGLLFRVAFTVACLGYVLWTVPFQDAVDLKAGGQAKGTVLAWEGGAVADPVTGVRLRAKDGTVAVLAPDRLAGEPASAVHLGLLSALGSVRWMPLLAALAFLGFNQPMMALRWKVLLDAQGIRLGFLPVLRLHLLGLFFNNTMPGQTGGDLVKSYAVAKRAPGRGTAAVVTVFLDRAVGLAGLVLLAGGVSAWMACQDPRFVRPAWIINGILLALAGGVGAYLSAWRQAWLPAATLSRLRGIGPTLAEIDKTVELYRHRKGAVAAALAFALLNHTGFILCGLAIGRAVGIGPDLAGLSHFIVLIPLVSMVGAIPVSVMGFGIGEIAYVKAFAMLGVPESSALALSLLTRFAVIAWGLMGGLAALLTRRMRAEPHVLGAAG